MYVQGVYHVARTETVDGMILSIESGTEFPYVRLKLAVLQA
jgi:hypothetical protein